MTKSAMDDGSKIVSTEEMNLAEVKENETLIIFRLVPFAFSTFQRVFYWSRFL